MERLCRDVHPAEVATPDGRVLRGRAFATSHRLIVWSEPERGRIERVLDVDLTHEGFVPVSRSTLPPAAALECPTADGTYWVNRGRGCGCGQIALKALGPPVSWTPAREPVA